MSASPQWKVYSTDNEYLAAFKNPVHALMFVQQLEAGASVRLGHTKASTRYIYQGGLIDSYDYALAMMR